MDIEPSELLSLCGNISDDSIETQKLRKFLKDRDYNQINDFLTEIPQSSIEDSGRILQDIVNETGTRLGFDVEFGSFTQGYDGLWASTTDDIDTGLVIETKKTDVYHIDPRKQPGNYMDKLTENGHGFDHLYGLLVVGESDVSSVANTIRGSDLQHEIRVISCENLARLLWVAKQANLSHSQLVELFKPTDSVNIGDGIELVEDIVVNISNEKITDADERENSLTSCVYAIIDSVSEEILYIGQSGSYMKAKVNHLYNGKDNTTSLRGAINHDDESPIDIEDDDWRERIVFEYWECHGMTRKERGKLRREKVEQHNPLYN